MTDKEKIIIDGKGCRYKTWDKDCALTGDNHGDNMEPCKFIDEKNCYYKQLKAKEQECEELKSQIDADYEDYSQELKTLRNIIENKEKRNARLFVISNNYRKALEEIEEIVNKKTETSICSECAYNHLPECKDNCMQDALENILDIINKTKDGKNE